VRRNGADRRHAFTRSAVEPLQAIVSPTHLGTGMRARQLVPTRRSHVCGRSLPICDRQALTSGYESPSTGVLRGSAPCERWYALGTAVTPIRRRPRPVAGRQPVTESKSSPCTRVTHFSQRRPVYARVTSTPSLADMVPPARATLTRWSRLPSGVRSSRSARPHSPAHARRHQYQTIGASRRRRALQDTAIHSLGPTRPKHARENGRHVVVHLRG